MPNQINLSQPQIDQLNQITSNGTQNFADGYRYIYSIIQDDPNVDAATKFFFQGAAVVNEGRSSADANLFIRDVTATGLAWDGRLATNPADADAQVQAIVLQKSARSSWRAIIESARTEF